jgi:hypothetical protein
MNGILITLAVLLGVIAIAALFIIFIVNRFRKRVENAVVDGVKQVIIENGSEIVKHATKKIKKK